MTRCYTVSNTDGCRMRKGSPNTRASCPMECRYLVLDGWGYSNNRSVNAVNAEENGKLPFSRLKAMTQRQLVEHICQHDSELDPIDEWAVLERKSKKTLLSCFVTNESHHVGIFCKLVDYYEFDPSMYRDVV